ncbi:type II toxin-antitoxin system RelE/ParE family toxin [Rugamonas apoptosis]|uniref:Type II toxin-antitoxin system RelE/ParE family toxin n=1 Tax=Rugamonas apoptosis TaxID=2758570 RepID=A0A7W2FAH5_9BURK|nr:type II toxin-antitoxin system RelE/ParE family toxin [Rugamonas apoptosis]MBA5688019.1 type II toxin-antitoxin system RelE/ParE family toxin [Rugamonas apoptosis]
MAGKCHVKLTANFERNLEEVESFLSNADAPHAFDALLDELTATVIPTLEHFPDVGRLFFERPTRSVEVGKSLEGLKRKLKAIGRNGEVREYVMSHYLLLYARFGDTIYLLSIRHHRQLSFDFQALWPTA